MTRNGRPALLLQDGVWQRCQRVRVMKLEIARALFLVAGLAVTTVAVAAWEEPRPTVFSKAEMADQCALPREAKPQQARSAGSGPVAVPVWPASRVAAIWLNPAAKMPEASHGPLAFCICSVLRGLGLLPQAREEAGSGYCSFLGFRLVRQQGIDTATQTG
jgi:hypothetical protein